MRSRNISSLKLSNPFMILIPKEDKRRREETTENTWKYHGRIPSKASCVKKNPVFSYRNQPVITCYVPSIWGWRIPLQDWIGEPPVSASSNGKSVSMENFNGLRVLLYELINGLIMDMNGKNPSSIFKSASFDDTGGYRFGLPSGNLT